MEMVPLGADLILPLSVLLAGYVHMDRASDEQVAECRAAVERHLHAECSHFLLARLADRYVGFIHLAWTFSTSQGLPALRVQGLYTAAEHRCQGVASALLQHAVGLARSRGANRLQLGTDTDNFSARRLYERFGFELLPGKQMYMKFL